MVERGKPALQSYIEALVGGNYVVAVENVTVTTSPTLVLPNDFERMAATLINTGTVDVRIAPILTVAANMGVVLGASGGNLSLVAAEDLALVGWSWFAVVASGTTTITRVTTTRFNPGGS